MGLSSGSVADSRVSGAVLPDARLTQTLSKGVCAH